MNLNNYVKIIIRRWWVIVITAIITMEVVIFGTNLQTKIYQASSKLRVATSAVGQGYSDYTYSDRLMNTYVQIATSEPVLNELMKQLNLIKPPKITAEILPNTELILITVQDPNPSMAAMAANTLADILITQSSQLYTGGGITSQEALGEQLAIVQNRLNLAQDEYQNLLIQTPAAPDQIDIARQAMNLQQNTYATLLSQYEQAIIRGAIQANMVTIVEPAMVPESPSKPNKILNYGLGLVLGLVGGLGLVFLFESLDTTLHTLDDIESSTKLATLAMIPKANKRQLNISMNGTSPFADGFRNLATKIQLIDHQQPSKVFLIMSAEPGQGKSTSVFNLALALAEAGKNVVAVDCDLHLPKLHKLFGLPNEFGLTNVLLRKEDFKKDLQVSPFAGINVLTSGPITDHQSRLLGSSKMAELIENLSEKFDYVLLDSPALLSFADTEILANYSNRLILVVRRNHAKRESIPAAIKFLAAFPEKAIGCIVNQAENQGYYHYYH